MDRTLTVRKLAADIVDAEIIPHIRDWDRAEPVDTAIIGKLGDLGLLGLTIEERYGGTEVDMLSYARVCEEGIVKLFENTCGSVDMSGLGGER